MVNNDLWTYREDIWVVTPAMGTDTTTRSTMATADLAGYSVEARDGSIGKIDEATSETNRAYLVVDTGPWIFGRKVLVPAGTIERIDRDNQTVHLNLTKDQIKDSPEFDPTRVNDDEYHSRLDDYYRRAGWTRAA